INEIHADPHPTAGDANGDGAVSTTQDEFVEIVNASGADVDISGWTLSDGFGVRHVFPAPTVVTDGCAVVVFAGGTPAGSFGGVIVQTASTGQLGLNNTGDTVTLNDGAADVATASYGAEGGNDQSLTLDPDVTGAAFVLHTVATGSGGARFSPGTGIDGTTFAGCTAPPAVAEIFEIQGPGLTSPFATQTVTTLGNVVTALASNGFFIQTPDTRADADPETSNGIFVFTGGAPGVAVGDEVDVTGQVVEFFNFTEFSNGPAVTFVSGGNPLPAAVTFDDTTPSPDQPQPATEFERYEGMLVTVTGGRIASGNQRFGTDPIAEAFAVAGADRPFREPGILFPGLPALPVFDGNPEKFELDPDRLGLPNQVLTGGSSFDAEGVLGFEFNGYELWPTALTVTPAPLPVPVSGRQPGEFTVGSQNLFRLFDDVDDPGINETVVSAAEYQRRLDKFSLQIRDVMDAPDVLAVEEAEKLGVLEDLAAEIAADDPSVVYTAYLVEGNDVGGIDTGFLVRDTINVFAVTQLAAAETLSVDGSLLHDRPPLLLEAEYTGGAGTFPITVLALHQRSLSGIDSPVDGPRVRQKRLEQAQSVATIVQGLQTTDPEVHLIVIGDLNAFEFSDGYVDVVGQIAGDFVPADNLLSGPDLVDPNLAKLTLGVTPGERYSFNFGGDAQAIDHALTSTALTPRVTSVEYTRGNSDAAADLIFDDSTPLRSS
ncbi:MAG: lamin tail domain-containing protein, partial [Chloroflexi bacterium]|nr:lamin tail domain-containing protein [Chloroflexota bacterium]